MKGAVTKKKKDGKISVKQKPMNKSHSERRFCGTLIEGITYHVEYVRLDYALHYPILHNECVY